MRGVYYDHKADRDIMTKEKVEEILQQVSLEYTNAKIHYANGEYDLAELDLKRIHDVILEKLGDPMEAGFMVP